MVLKKQLQVTSLYKLSLQVVTNKIFKFVKEHWKPCEFCSVCNTEQCSTIKPVTAMLKLPEVIIQSIYAEMCVLRRSDVSFQYSMFDSHTGLLYLLLSLLKVEQTSVKIKFRFKMHEVDIPFIRKFGKNINSLLFQERNYGFQIIDNNGWQGPAHAKMIQQWCVSRNQTDRGANIYDISVLICDIILPSATNIKELNFDCCIKLNDEIFEVIGRECTQLKVLNNICVGDEKHHATVQSFVKLLFHTNDAGLTYRNKCSDTLETIFFGEFDTVYDSKMNGILDLLLPNLPNLKSLGNKVILEHYLNQLKEGEVGETALNYILFGDVTKQIAKMLEGFCPNLKTLDVYNLESGTIESISSLKGLEYITLYESEPIIVSEIFTSHWSNLKVLSFSTDYIIHFIHFDIDLVAKNLPLLTKLDIGISRVSWTGNTYFNCLETVLIEWIDCNTISWIASFASTAKSVNICSRNRGTMSPDNCVVLLTVPFPNLKCLCIRDFPFFFQFYTSVLYKLPKLEICRLYDFFETTEEKALRLEQLSQFMKTKFIQCEI